MTGRPPRDVAALRRAAAMLPPVPPIAEEAHPRPVCPCGAGAEWVDDGPAAAARVDVDRAAAVHELVDRYPDGAPWWCPACGTVGVSDVSDDVPGTVLATV